MGHKNIDATAQKNWEGPKRTGGVNACRRGSKCQMLEDHGSRIKYASYIGLGRTLRHYIDRVQWIAEDMYLMVDTLVTGKSE